MAEADDPHDLHWHRVGKIADIAPDRPKSVKFDDELYVGIYDVRGHYYAIGDVCPHQFALLTDGYIEDEEYVECPLHQARFHIPTGRTMGPPADEDVATYPVERVGDELYVGLPRKSGE